MKNIEVGVILRDINTDETIKFNIDAVQKTDITERYNKTLVEQIADAWVDKDGKKSNIRATAKYNIDVYAYVKIDNSKYIIGNNFKWNDKSSNIKMTHVYKAKCTKTCMHRRGTSDCIGCEQITSAEVITYKIDKYKIYIGIDTCNHFYVEVELNYEEIN